ncbi:hypothetical protein A0J61_11388 [Choanephora cucurbitarum]|uniref:C2H2-type domain-containing protein n=1 Tax=Choanephora cucurbitarum TaxID=101091 RepID=A0A1C7MUP2_9FUNG|nr:hypothetical protein A0J61_11388 [Choanephora cucurbitarum]
MQNAQTQIQRKVQSDMESASVFSMFNERTDCPFCSKQLLLKKSLVRHLRGVHQLEQQLANGIANGTHGVVLRREENEDGETEDYVSEDEYVGAASDSDEEEQVDLGVQAELDRLANECVQEAQGSDATE